MDRERDRLRDLSARLTRLHGYLLARERRAYETRHGAVGSHEMLRLLLHDERFAWLRTLSSLMAQIDAAVDVEELTAADVERALRATRQLLKSGDTGAFQDKYRDALQDSPDVVMAHADVTQVLRDLTSR